MLWIYRVVRSVCCGYIGLLGLCVIVLLGHEYSVTVCL